MALAESVRKAVEISEDVCRLKLMATGVQSSALDRGTVPARVETEEAFAALVTIIYKYWRETSGSDIKFLLPRKMMHVRTVRFDAALYSLRTAGQHADNRRAVEDAAGWMRARCGHKPLSAADWELCGMKLLEEFIESLIALRARAAATLRNDQLRAQWRSRAELSVEAVYSAVVADLGLNFSRNSREHHIREIGRKIHRDLRPAMFRTDLAERVAVCYLASQFRQLPIHYRELLEGLGLLGDIRASDCVKLAHAVAEVTGLSGDSFREKFYEVWRIL